MENYKTIENGLIPVMENEKGEKLVDARLLHEFLEVGKDFTTWIKDKIEKYGFLENVDYAFTLTKIGERKNVIKHEYILTLDTAKEISMVENNEKGREARKYFIAVDKKYRELTQTPRQIPQIESLETVNQSLQILLPLLDEIELAPEIRILTAKELYKKAGVELPIDVKAKEKFYDTVQIAKELGVFTKTNNPASTAISQIIKKIDVLPDEKVDTFEGKGNWQGTVTKYTFAVIERLMKWFEENKFPTIIEGEKKNYTVVYKSMGAIKGA